MESAFAWPGGKRALVPTLLKFLPQHTLYVEVFAGSAKLLFAKEPSRREVINDLNGDVTNFFRVAKHRAAELAERLELECVHAGRFRELLNVQPLCEIDRALRFAYLTWYSFSSKGEHFASSNHNARMPRPIHAVREVLERTAGRLASVLIEQRDFMDILKRYDGPETCFYLDPPYVAFQPNGRYAPLSSEQRDALFSSLSKLRGKCLVSFDNHPEIRHHATECGLFTHKVEVRYTLGGAHKGKNAPELLIANYPLAA